MIAPMLMGFHGIKSRKIIMLLNGTALLRIRVISNMRRRERGLPNFVGSLVSVND